MASLVESQRGRNGPGGAASRPPDWSYLLTVNGGPSSLKFAIFRRTEPLARRASGRQRVAGGAGSPGGMSGRDKTGLARVPGLADPQQCRLVHVEVNVHRVERHDGGQERLVLADEVADGQVIAADLAVDRRGDPGELEVELVDLRGSSSSLDPCRGLVDGGE